MPGRGVVPHAVPSLTLLALRHCVTGQYMPRADVEAAATADAIPLVPVACALMPSVGAHPLLNQVGTLLAVH